VNQELVQLFAACLGLGMMLAVVVAVPFSFFFTVRRGLRSASGGGDWANGD